MKFKILVSSILCSNVLFFASQIGVSQSGALETVTRSLISSIFVLNHHFKVAKQHTNQAASYVFKMRPVDAP